MKKNKKVVFEEDKGNILQRAWRKEPELCKIGIVLSIPVVLFLILWGAL